eukprot:6209302-Pleurochrysis_carterae.AAC.1
MEHARHAREGWERPKIGAKPKNCGSKSKRAQTTNSGKGCGRAAAIRRSCVESEELTWFGQRVGYCSSARADGCVRVRPGSSPIAQRLLSQAISWKLPFPIHLRWERYLNLTLLDDSASLIYPSSRAFRGEEKCRSCLFYANPNDVEVLSFLLVPVVRPAKRVRWESGSQGGPMQGWGDEHGEAVPVSGGRMRPTPPGAPERAALHYAKAGEEGCECACAQRVRVKPVVPKRVRGLLFPSVSDAQMLFKCKVATSILIHRVNVILQLDVLSPSSLGRVPTGWPPLIHHFPFEDQYPT